jgi:hypothetical protein
LQRLLGEGRRLNISELLSVETAEAAAARAARREFAAAEFLGSRANATNITLAEVALVDDYEPTIALAPTLVVADAGPGQALLAALNLADPAAQAAVSTLQYFQLFGRWVVRANSPEALENVVLPRLLAASGKSPAGLFLSYTSATKTAAEDRTLN